MNEMDHIVELLARAREGGGWYGSSLGKLLADVTAEEASSRAMPGGHTIWQQVLHVIAWHDVARGLLDGQELIDLPEEVNWPVVEDTSESAWRDTLRKLEQSYGKLRESMTLFPQECLHENVSAYANASGNRVSFYHLLHGVVQHDVYHAGQIAVLRNAQR